MEDDDESDFLNLTEKIGHRHGIWFHVLNRSFTKYISNILTA